MKDLTIYLWSRIGRDGDGYETDYQFTDEECETLAGLVRKYIADKCTGEPYIDEKEFVEEFLCKDAPLLYERLSEETTNEFLDSMIESESEYFDEEAEGCTIEEYIKDTYYWGFWIKENCLLSLI